MAVVRIDDHNSIAVEALVSVNNKQGKGEGLFQGCFWL